MLGPGPHADPGWEGDDMGHAEGPQPPRAPDTRRAFRPARHHTIGIAILGLLVVAAAAGAFGATEGRAHAETPGLHLSVSYPERTRAKLPHTLSVEVSNVGSSDLATVFLAIDRRYLDGFSAVGFTPAVARLTRAAYVVDLSDLGVGETRLVSVSLTAAERWGRGGFVEARAGEDVARVELRSFVYP
jgi:hypothetical protein